MSVSLRGSFLILTDKNNKLAYFGRSWKLEIFNLLWHIGPSFVHVCQISDPFFIARVSPEHFSLFLFSVDLPERNWPHHCVVGKIRPRLDVKTIALIFSFRFSWWKRLCSSFYEIFGKTSAFVFEEVRFSFVIATILSLRIVDQLLPIWRFCACTFLA